MLKVKLTGFHLDKAANYTDLGPSLGFSIDKTVSDTLNPYIQDTDSSCILTKNMEEKDKAGIIKFILDFQQGFLRVKCSNNVKSITILEKEREKATGGALSDEGLFNRPKRDSQSLKKRNMKEQDVDSMFKDEIVEHYIKEDQEKALTSVKPAVSSSTPKIIVPAADKIPPVVSSGSTSTTAKMEMKESDNVGGVQQGVAAVPEEVVKIPLTLDTNGEFETSFYIYILNEKLEGLYSMFFHNCLNYPHKGSSGKKSVSFSIEIEEKNSDSYLSAGEMPLPALYQMLAVLFFLSGCFWVFILKKTGSEQVFRIHWIMASLVFLKSLSLFFHGVNYNKIATHGIHVESWAVLYYITHLLKGGLLFFTIGNFKTKIYNL